MSVSHRVTCAWMSVCLLLSAIFCNLINEGYWGAKLLRQMLFQIGEKLLRRLFRCCNRLMERIVWAVRNVTSGTSASNRAERPSKTTPNLDGLPRQWTTITLRKCLLWFVKIVAWLSVKLPKKWESVKVHATWFRPPPPKKTEDASCCRKIYTASADASLLIHEFLTKHVTTVVPQPPCPLDLAPADFFMFPKWKSSLKCRRFQTVDEIEENLLGIFAPSRKTPSRTLSRNRKKGLGRCLESGGGYCEGGSLD